MASNNKLSSYNNNNNNNTTLSFPMPWGKVVGSRNTLRYVATHWTSQQVILLSQAAELTACANCQHVRYSSLTEHDYRLMLLSLPISNKSITVRSYIDFLLMIWAIDYYLSVLRRLYRYQNVPGNYLSTKSIIAYLKSLIDMFLFLNIFVFYMICLHNTLAT